jgi:hypothetical protein
MEEVISVQGQWYGYFSYGPDYGPELEGEKVVFSLLISQQGDGQFVGKCIELEGIGASREVSTIKGFVDGSTISFQKEYATYSTIDEQGNEGSYQGGLEPRISYQGVFDAKTNSFNGSWEIWGNEVPYGDETLVDICTGNWQISRQSSTYGV